VSTTPAQQRTGTRSATAVWRGSWRCDVQAGDYSITVDEPVSVGGTGEGPMPTDLLLASASSCYALALAWAARKRGFELPDLQVTAVGEYGGPRFARITLQVSTSLPRERLEPLLEPAQRACYVSQTLARQPELSVEVTAPAAS
jgi:putative redox protein